MRARTSLAAAAVAALLGGPRAAQAQERLGVEAQLGVAIGASPGLGRGATVGLQLKVAAVQGPIKLGGELVVAQNALWADRSTTTVGLLGTVGLAAPKLPVLPIVDLHVGAMLAESGGPLARQTRGGAVIGSTLGLTVPVSAHAGMYAAGKGLLPLFASADGRRFSPLLAEVGIHVF